MLFCVHFYSKIIFNFFDSRGYFWLALSPKFLNKGIWGPFITFCINSCYPLANSLAARKELEKGPWARWITFCIDSHVFFLFWWPIGSFLTHFLDSLQLGLYVTKLHMSKLTTFLFLGRFAWLFNSIILTVWVSKKYNKTNHKDSRSNFCIFKHLV